METSNNVVPAAYGIIATAMILVGLGVCVLCDSRPEKWLRWLVPAIIIFGVSIVVFLVSVGITVSTPEHVVLGG